MEVVSTLWALGMALAKSVVPRVVYSSELILMGRRSMKLHSCVTVKCVRYNRITALFICEMCEKPQNSWRPSSVLNRYLLDAWGSAAVGAAAVCRAVHRALP